MKNDESRDLNKLFFDICLGFSRCRHEGNDFYVKHFNIYDQGVCDRFYDKSYSRAQNDGLPTETERLDFLRTEGTWTSEDEVVIAQKEGFIKGLNKSLAKLVIEKQQLQIKDTIKTEQENLQKKREERDSLLQGTCEKYAATKQNNFILFKSLFKDEGLQESKFTAEEFDELTSRSLIMWLGLYVESTKHLDPDRIKSLALSNFFTNYFSLCGDNSSVFFGGRIYEWTFYQINLINYGKIFKNIFENVPNIPDHIKDDPDAVLEFASQKGKRDEYEERGADKDAYSVMGASTKDMAKMGVEPKGGVDLHEYASEKGNRLSMQDFIEMQGD